MSTYGGCMGKTKLAICMKDLEYQNRFVSCFMNHYNHQFELHVFTSPLQLEDASMMEYAVIITDEYNTEEVTIFVERAEIILILEENLGTENKLEEKTIYTEKYQEVYKIVELLECFIADKLPGQRTGIGSTEIELIGIYSLSQEIYQAPFAVLLGKIYGEFQKVLILDLQSYSGLRQIDEEITSMGLEDLLSVAQTGNYSKSRMLECICHEGNWDYICSTQNHECLAEGAKELYEVLIKRLVQDFGYEMVVVNFGSAFPGQRDMMEMCQCMYFLTGKNEGGNWREKVFEQELIRQGREKLLQTMQRIEFSQNACREANCRTLAETWTWGEFGEILRQQRKKEKAYGEIM